jgi:hypothetical protein
MVAVTGGLFVAMVVFALARDGSRFYQREARVADATMSGLVGFERLRADISRAGFLATPNIRFEPHLCGDPIGDATWPPELQRLAALRIVQNGSPANSAVLAGNGLTPDAIVLAGSYASNEQFPVWNITNAGANFIVFLQWQAGPLARLGYTTATDPVRLAILTTLFGTGRLLRIQDQSGEIQFGTIANVTGGAQPQIVLTQNPVLLFRQNAGSTCGLRGNVTGASVNVVNLMQYDVRSLGNDSNFGGANPSYAPLYAGPNPWDTDRTELVRVELDSSGTPIQGTEELVAENAVDLKFGITTVTDILNGSDPALQSFAPGDPLIDSWAGDLTVAASGPNQGPHRVRAVRVRLSVRSAEPDREGQVVAASNVAPGLYRIGLGVAGAAPFARVRTMQADLALHNQMGVMW